MDGQNEKKAKAPLACKKANCTGRANQNCKGLLCSLCCRAAGLVCQAHKVRAAPRPKDPEDLPIGGPGRATAPDIPNPADKNSAKGGTNVATVDIAALGVLNDDSVGASKEVEDKGKADGSKGGNGSTVGSSDQNNVGEMDAARVGKAAAQPFDNEGGEGGANTSPESSSSGQDASRDDELTAQTQESGPPEVSASLEKPVAEPDASCQQNALSQAELQALWNENDSADEMPTDSGDEGFFTPEGSLKVSEGVNELSWRVGNMQAQSSEPLPGFGDEGPFSIAGFDSQPDFGHGSGAGTTDLRSEGLEGEAARRSSSQQVTLPSLQASEAPRETQSGLGAGAYASFVNSSLLAELDRLARTSAAGVTCGGVFTPRNGQREDGADLYCQLAETSMPGQPATFAGRTGSHGNVDAWSSASSQLLRNVETPFTPAKGGLLDKSQMELLQARRLNPTLPLQSMGQELGHPKQSLNLGRPNSAETVANALRQAPGYVSQGLGLGNIIQDRRKSWPSGDSCWGKGAAALIDAQPPMQLPSSPSASMSLDGLSLGAPLREGAPSEEHSGSSGAKRYRLPEEAVLAGNDFPTMLSRKPPSSIASASARKRARKSPTKSSPLKPLEGLPSPPLAISSTPLAGPIPSAPTLTNLALDSLPPASIPILLMQLKALRATVPPKLHKQILASNRPLQILADALDAERGASLGADVGNARDDVSDVRDDVSMESGPSESARGVGTGLRVGGMSLEAVSNANGALSKPSSSGDPVSSSSGLARGAKTERADAHGHRLQLGVPALGETAAQEDTLLDVVAPLDGLHERGERSKQWKPGAFAPTVGIMDGSRTGGARDHIKGVGLRSSKPPAPSNAQGREGASDRGLASVESGKGISTPTQGVKVEGCIAKAQNLPVGSAAADANIDRYAGTALSPTMKLENGVFGPSGEVDGRASLFAMPPSISCKDSELQWSLAVGRKPDLDEDSALTTEESVVDRAKHRLRETTKLMQQLLPAKTPAALGGNSIQDRESSVFLTARDILQEATMWAPPIGENGGMAQERSVVSELGGEGKLEDNSVVGKRKADAGRGRDSALGEGYDEYLVADEELTARVDYLRRHIQRLEGCPAGVEVLQQILNFDQSQTAGLGLTHEQLERRATSLQRKTPPGLPTAVGPLGKQKPHQVVTSFSDLF